MVTGPIGQHGRHVAALVQHHNVLADERAIVLIRCQSTVVEHALVSMLNRAIVRRRNAKVLSMQIIISVPTIVVMLIRHH